MAFEAFALPFVFIVSVLALGFAYYLTKNILKEDQGSEAMQEIAKAIKEGAEAFLKRQYKTIAILAAVAAVIIFGIYFYVDNLPLAVNTAIAFIVGAAFSAIAGVVGMAIAVRTNIRTAAAAKTSISKAIKIALRGGAVSGFLVVALSLLGVAGLYIMFGADPKETPVSLFC